MWEEQVERDREQRELAHLGGTSRTEQGAKGAGCGRNKKDGTGSKGSWHEGDQAGRNREQRELAHVEMQMSSDICSNIQWCVAMDVG